MSVLETIKRIQDKDPVRHIEFRALPHRMKTEVVGFLKCQGMLAEELAAALNIPRSTVYYYWKKYTAELAEFVKRNANQFIGRLSAKAAHLYKAAKQTGDLRLCWKIECDLFDKLVELGFIDTVPSRVDLTLRDRRDIKTIEAELVGDMDLLEYLRDGQPKLALPAPGENGDGAPDHPADGGGGEIPQDADERSD